MIGLAEYNFDKEISSWWCGKDVQYVFCDSEACGGGAGDRQSGAGNINNPESGHDNLIKFVELKPYDAADKGQVTMFRGKDCKGSAVGFELEGMMKHFSKNMIKAAGMSDNKISSVMVPYGYYLRVMNGNSGDLDLSDYEQIWGSKYDRDGEMDCVNLSDYNYDDKVSSFRIYAV